MLRKRIAVLVAAAMMVLSMLAAAAPVFAAQPLFTGSAASEGNKDEFGPKQGYNFGQCKNHPLVSPGSGPGNGKTTARENPSFNGGADYSTAEGADTISILCSK